jgi:hypothetical protein
MTEKPTPIPLSRRVMPSIILDDIKGVSPMTAPSDTISNTKNNMITERQGEGQIDIDVDPETGRRIIRVDLGDMPVERTLEIINQLKTALNG